MDGGVKVDVRVELRLGMVSWVGSGIGVLGGVDLPQAEGGVKSPLTSMGPVSA